MLAPIRPCCPIVLPPTKAEGAKFASLWDIEPVAIVTPRSEHAAYGIVADRIVEAFGPTDEQRSQLLPYVTPCLATSTGAGRSRVQAPGAV